MRYSRLFSPIKIGKIWVKNRIAMAPMGTNLQAMDGSVTERLVEYFEERAKGGVGLIISPFVAVNESGRMTNLSISSDRAIPGLSGLCETCKLYGAKFVLQLAHFGGATLRRFTQKIPVAPSSVSSPLYETTPKELSIREIESLIKDFIEGARRAKAAGFDGVEVHAAHTYLIGQFISPHTNKRRDEYGGNFKRRMNFPAKIIEGIREKCGGSFIIGVKFSAYEHLKNGVDLKLGKCIARFLQQIGVDYLHISSTSPLVYQQLLDCNYPPLPSIYSKPGVIVELAEQIKPEVDIPIIVGGGIVDPSYAEEVLLNKKADMVALGRVLLADPEWPIKAQRGEVIKTCIKCNVCHIVEVLNKKEIRCTVNPATGREKKYKIRKARVKKKVVVVGAGPAGMEASLIASQRGHQVILYEEKNEIGGKMIISSIPSFKQEIKMLLQWYKDNIEKSEVEVKLSQRVNPDILSKEKPDVIILATGAEIKVPNIPGVTRKPVFTAVDFLEHIDTIKLGKDIIILGAGLVGCEIAWYLGLQGKSVKLVDILNSDEILAEEHPINRAELLKGLYDTKVSICGQTTIKKINSDSVIMDKNGQQESHPMDNLILATGFTPRKELKDALLSKCSRLKCETYQIGDCKEPRKLYEAIHEAAHVARII